MKLVSVEWYETADLVFQGGPVALADGAEAAGRFELNPDHVVRVVKHQDVVGLVLLNGELWWITHDSFRRLIHA